MSNEDEDLALYAGSSARSRRSQRSAHSTPRSKLQTETNPGLQALLDVSSLPGTPLKTPARGGDGLGNLLFDDDASIEMNPDDWLVTKEQQLQREIEEHGRRAEGAHTMTKVVTPQQRRELQDEYKFQRNQQKALAKRAEELEEVETGTREELEKRLKIEQTKRDAAKKIYFDLLQNDQLDKGRAMNLEKIIKEHEDMLRAIKAQLADTSVDFETSDDDDHNYEESTNNNNVNESDESDDHYGKDASGYQHAPHGTATAQHGKSQGQGGPAPTAILETSTLLQSPQLLKMGSLSSPPALSSKTGPAHRNGDDDNDEEEQEDEEEEEEEDEDDQRLHGQQGADGPSLYDSSHLPLEDDDVSGDGDGDGEGENAVIDGSPSANSSSNMDHLSAQFLPGNVASTPSPPNVRSTEKRLSASRASVVSSATRGTNDGSGLGRFSASSSPGGLHSSSLDVSVRSTDLNPAHGTWMDDDGTLDVLRDLLKQIYADVSDHAALDHIKKLGEFARSILQQREDYRQKHAVLAHSHRNEITRVREAAEEDQEHILALVEEVTSEKEELESALELYRKDANTITISKGIDSARDRDIHHGDMMGIFNMLGEHVASAAANASAIAERDAMITELQQTLEIKNSAISELEAVASQQQDILDRQHGQLEDKVARIAELEDECAASKQEILDLKASLEEQTSKMSTQATALQRHKEAAEARDAELAQAMKQVDELKKQGEAHTRQLLSSNEEALNELDKQKFAWSQEKAELEMKLQELSTKYTSQRDNFEEQAATLTLKNQRLATEVTALRATLDENKSTGAQELATLRTDNANMASDLDEKERAIKALSERLELQQKAVNTALDDFEQKVASLQRDLDVERRQHSHDVEAHEEAISELRNRFEAEQRKVEDLEGHAADFMKKHQRAQTELEATRKQLEAANAALKSTEKTNTDTVRELTAAKEALSAATKNLGAESDQLQTSKKHAETLAERVETLNRELSNLQLELATKEDAWAEKERRLTKEHQSIADNLDGKKGMVAVLDKQLKDALREVARLTGIVHQHEAEAMFDDFGQDDGDEGGSSGGEEFFDADEDHEDEGEGDGEDESVNEGEYHENAAFNASTSTATAVQQTGAAKKGKKAKRFNARPAAVVADRPKLPEPLATNYHAWVEGMCKLMSQEKMGARDLFSRLDVSERNMLNAKEVRAGLDLADVEMSDAAFAGVFHHLDANGDKFVDLNEFKRDLKYSHTKSRYGRQPAHQRRHGHGTGSRKGSVLTPRERKRKELVEQQKQRRDELLKKVDIAPFSVDFANVSSVVDYQEALGEAMTTIRAMERRMHALEQHLLVVQAEFTKAKDAMKDAHSQQLDALNNELYSAKKAAGNHRAQVNLLTKMHDELQASLEKANGLRLEAEEDKKALAEQLETAEAATREFSEQCQMLERLAADGNNQQAVEIVKLRDQYNLALEAQRKLKADVKREQERLEAATARCEGLQQKADELQEVVFATRQKSQLLEAQLDAMRQARDEALSAQGAAGEQLQSLQRTVDEANARVESTLTELAAAHDQQSELEAQLRSATVDAANAGRELENARSDMAASEDAMKHLEAANRELADHVARLEEKCATEVERTKEQITEKLKARSECDALQAKYEEAVGRAEEVEGDLRNTIRELEAQRGVHESQLALQKDQLHSLRERSMDGSKRAVEMQASLEQLEEQRAADVATLASLRETIARLDRERADADDRLQESREKCQVANSELQGALADFKRARLEHERYVEQLKSAQQDAIRKLQAEHESVLAELRAAQARSREDQEDTHRQTLDHLAQQHEREATLAAAEHARSVDALKHTHERALQDMLQKHAQAMDKLRKEHEDAVKGFSSDGDARLEAASAQHASQVAELKRRHETNMQELSTKHDERINALVADHNDELAALSSQHAAKVADLTARQAEALRLRDAEHREAVAALTAALEEASAKAQRGNSDMEEEKAELSKRVAEARRNSAFQAEQAAEAVADAEKLREQVKELEEKLEAQTKSSLAASALASNHCAMLEKLSEGLEFEVKQVKDRLSKQKVKTESTKDELDRVKREQKRLRQDVFSLQQYKGECVELQAQLEKVTGENQHLTHELHTANESIRNWEKLHAQHEVDAEQTLRAALEDQAIQNKSSTAIDQKIIQSLRDKLFEEQKRAQEAKDGLMMRIAADKRELQHLRDKLASVKINLFDLASQDSFVLDNLHLGIAVADYDPRSLADASDREGELCLALGDMVFLIGPADDDGFYHAIANGERGLVPHTYVGEAGLTPVQWAKLVLDHPKTDVDHSAYTRRGSVFLPSTADASQHGLAVVLENDHEGVADGGNAGDDDMESSGGGHDRRRRGSRGSQGDAAEQLQAEIAELSEENDVLEGKVAEMRTQVQQLEKDLGAATARGDKMEATATAATAEVAAVTQRLEKLQRVHAQCRASDETLAEKTDQLHAAKNEVSRLQHELRDVRQQTETLQRQLSAEHDRNQSLTVRMLELESAGIFQEVEDLDESTAQLASSQRSQHGAVTGTSSDVRRSASGAQLDASLLSRHDDDDGDGDGEQDGEPASNSGRDGNPWGNGGRENPERRVTELWNMAQQLRAELEEANRRVQELESLSERQNLATLAAQKERAKLDSNLQRATAAIHSISTSLNDAATAVYKSEEDRYAARLAEWPVGDLHKRLDEYKLSKRGGRDDLIRRILSHERIHFFPARHQNEVQQRMNELESTYQRALQLANTPREKLIERVAELERVCKGLEERGKHAVAAARDADSQMARTEEKMKALSAELSEARDVIQALEAESAAQSPPPAMEGRVASLEAELTTCKGQLAALHDFRAAASSFIGHARATMPSSFRSASEADSLREAEKLLKAATGALSEVQAMETKVEEVTKHSFELHEENAKLETKAGGLQKQLEEMVAAMGKQTEEHDAMMAQLHAQLMSAHTKIEAFDAALIAMQKEIARIASLQRNTSMEVKSLRDSTHEDNRATRILADLRSLQATYSHMQAENKRLHAEVTRLRESLQQTEGIVSEARDIRSAVREQLLTPGKHVMHVNKIIQEKSEEFGVEFKGTPTMDRFLSRTSRLRRGEGRAAQQHGIAEAERVLDAGSNSGDNGDDTVHSSTFDTSSVGMTPSEALAYLKEELACYQKIFEELSHTTSVQAHIIERLMEERSATSSKPTTGGLSSSLVDDDGQAVGYEESQRAQATISQLSTQLEKAISSISSLQEANTRAETDLQAARAQVREHESVVAHLDQLSRMLESRQAVLKAKTAEMKRLTAENERLQQQLAVAHAKGLMANGGNLLSKPKVVFGSENAGLIDSSGIDAGATASRLALVSAERDELSLDLARATHDLENAQLRLKKSSQSLQDTLSTCEQLRHENSKQLVRVNRYKAMYMRTEAARKGLIFQKRYLILLLGRFDTREAETLRLLSLPARFVQQREDGTLVEEYREVRDEEREEGVEELDGIMLHRNNLGRNHSSGATRLGHDVDPALLPSPMERFRAAGLAVVASIRLRKLKDKWLKAIRYRS